MIITIAGKAGEDDRRVNYICDILGIENGTYLNSLDVLLGSDDQHLTIIGSEEAIEVQKKLLGSKLETRSISPVYHLFDPQKSDDVFSLIFQILEKIPLDEPIILDITHGYRDHSMVAAYAAMVSTFMSKHTISLVYAKMEDRDKFRYVNLSAYSDLAEYTFYLRLFYHTSSIGHYRGEDILLRAMNRFGEDFLANNIQKLINESYPQLKYVLQEAKDIAHFSPLLSIIEKIQQRLVFLDKYHKLSGAQQYLALAQFAESMDYSIIALTYMHESISLYLDEVFGELLLDTRDQNNSSYQKSQDIRAIIRREDNVFDHAFFKTVDEIREMRNNLAHLSSEYNNRSVTLLSLYIKKLEQHYNNDVHLNIVIPKRLNMGHKKNEKMKLDNIEQELWKYLKNTSINQNISFKQFIPELLQAPINPSPYIPKKSVEALTKLMQNSAFKQWVKKYAKLLN